MIKNSPIVEDTRRVRRMISEKFDHDIRHYIDYLQREAASRQAKKTIQRSNSSETHASVENHEQKRKETNSN